MFTSLRRIIASGFVGFYRNFSVSLSAVVIIAISLLAFVGMYIASEVLQASIKQLESKVDVNVYFTPDAEQEDIDAIRSQLSNIDQVDQIDFVSREQALENFKERNADNEIILNSLDVLEENPLGASFNIRAKQISQYEQIASYLDTIEASDQYGPIIESVNYNQNKRAIEKINTLIDYSQQFGIALAVLMSILSLIIVYNTIRLTIYTQREEISVMRLVGASRFFARGPFVIEGMLYGVAGTLLAVAVLWPSIYYGSPYLNQIFVLNAYELYMANLQNILLAMLGIGVALGLLSSSLAIRRYLDI